MIRSKRSESSSGFARRWTDSGRLCQLLLARQEVEILLEGRQLVNLQLEKNEVRGSVIWSEIDGNVQIKENGSSNTAQNVVGGDVQLEKNGADTRIRFNTIGGNCQAKDNELGGPGAPVFGNVVAGDAEDQCDV